MATIDKITLNGTEMDIETVYHTHRFTYQTTEIAATATETLTPTNPLPNTAHVIGVKTVSTAQIDCSVDGFYESGVIQITNTNSTSARSVSPTFTVVYVDL